MPDRVMLTHYFHWVHLLVPSIYKTICRNKDSLFLLLSILFPQKNLRRANWESHCFQPFWVYQEDQYVFNCTPDTDVHGSSLMPQEDGDGHWRVSIGLSGSITITKDHNQVAKLSSPLCTIATLSGRDWRFSIQFRAQS